MTEKQHRLRRQRKLGASRAALLVLCALVLLGFSFRKSFLRAAADYLDVGRAPAEADVIYVLGGDIHVRPLAAAEIYERGLAPRILMSRVIDLPATRLGILPNETDAARELLIRLGVPDSAIIILNDGVGVSSTTEEAAELRRYLEKHPTNRVMVVTTEHHTRRARWNLERQLEGIDTELWMVGVEDPRFSAENWWRSEAGLLMYLEEYLKFLHNMAYR